MANITQKEWDDHVERSKRVERAILGDPLMKQPGIAEMVKQHDDKLLLIDSYKNRGIGILAAIALVSGIIGKGIWEGISTFFHKLFI
jgi:hypothetical protein